MNSIVIDYYYYFVKSTILQNCSLVLNEINFWYINVAKDT